MILKVTDFTETTEFYRMVSPLPGGDTSDILGVIAEGERQFCDVFGLAPEAIEGDKTIEALKFFTYALWLRMQATRKTASGAGAKINFTQSQNYSDWVRRQQAYNRACVLMGRNEKKMLKILNF